MRRAIFPCLAFFFAFSAPALSAAEYILVSDLDDTVKITNVRDKSQAMKNALFSKDAFTGMKELFQEMIGWNDSFQEGTDLFFLSGSPTLIKGRIESFLSHHEFPFSEIILKNWFKDGDTFEYKSQALREIAESTDLPLVLVGDDTEHDHHVYAEFIRTQPERVLSAYIRRVVDEEELAEGIEPFYSAFDIAYQETIAGRLSLEQARAVAHALLANKDLALLIPEFADCPDSAEEISPVDELEWLKAQVDARIAKACESRN